MTLSAHPRAALFLNPDFPESLEALDLEDDQVVWRWPNVMNGWEQRKKIDEHPLKDSPASQIPPERGLFSGWPGVQKVAEAYNRGGRPHLSYDDRLATLRVRATNREVIHWRKIAEQRGLGIEEWLAQLARDAVGVNGAR